MTNEYYNANGTPAESSDGESAVIRAEFDAVATFANKMPILAGNSGKVVTVKTAEDGLEAKTLGTFIASVFAALSAKTTPVDADQAIIVDSEASSVGKRLTFANLWVWIQAKIATTTATLSEMQVGSETGIRAMSPALVRQSWEEVQAPGQSSYDVGDFFLGKPTSSQVIWIFPVIRAMTFDVDMALSRAKARVAATAETIFSVQKNGVEFGTMTFAAAGTTATFVAATPPSHAAGDYIYLVAPASADATLEDISWVLAGQI